MKRMIQRKSLLILVIVGLLMVGLIAGVSFFGAVRSGETVANAIPDSEDFSIGEKHEVLEGDGVSVEIYVSEGEDKQLFMPNISLEVTKETTKTIAEKIANDPKIKKELRMSEEVAYAYNLKLMRAEESIMPSDIAEGMRLRVTVEVPENLMNKQFRILSIAKDGTVKEVANVVRTGNNVSMVVDEINELVFAVTNEDTIQVINNDTEPTVEAKEATKKETNPAVIVSAVLLTLIFLQLVALTVIFILKKKKIMK